MGLETIRNFYDSRAKTYGLTDAEGVLRYKAAISLAKFDNQNLVLDVGCKVSVLNSLLTQKHIPHKYYGIDIAAGVSDGQEESSRSIVRADVSDGIPFRAGSFTHVFCLELLEHVASPLLLLLELHRVLREGGQLLLSVPNPYYWAEVCGNIRGLPDTEGHICSFTPQNLQRLLEFSAFKIRARRGTYARVPFMHRLWPDSLTNMRSWLLARSVAYLVTKNSEPLLT